MSTTHTNSPALNPAEAVNDLRQLVLDAKKTAPAFRCPESINRLGLWLKAIGDVGMVSADDVIAGQVAIAEPANALELATAREEVEAAKQALGDTLGKLDEARAEAEAARSALAEAAKELAEFRALYEIERTSALALGNELADARRLLDEAKHAQKAASAAPSADVPVTGHADEFVPLAGTVVPDGITEEAAERTRHLRWAYSVVARYPDCTTAEMAHNLNCALYPLRTAVRALQSANWVVSSGTRTCSISTRSANTYRVADKDKLPRAGNDLAAMMDAQGEGVDEAAPAPAEMPAVATIASAPSSVVAPPEPEKPKATVKAKAKPKDDDPPVPGTLPFPPPTGQSDRPKVTVYTDGACQGNPGPGGFAAVMLYGTDGQATALRRNITGAHPETTNNQMELMAAIAALEALKDPCVVNITTDSQYVRTGITEWITRWKANGWRTAAKKAVKNADLWKRLDAACEKHTVNWNWTAGHNGHPGNEEADKLATKAIVALQAGTLQPIDFGSSLEDSTATDAAEMAAAPNAGTPDASGNDAL